MISLAVELHSAASLCGLHSIPLITWMLIDDNAVSELHYSTQAKF